MFLKGLKSIGHGSQTSLTSVWVGGGKPLSLNVGRYKVREETRAQTPNSRFTEMMFTLQNILEDLDDKTFSNF